MTGLLWILGCSAGGETSAHGHSSGADAQIPAGSQMGATCVHRNQTQPCTCADEENAAGAQTCIDGMWSACACAGPDAAGGGGPLPDFAGNNRTDITFVWEHTPAGSGADECLPGAYEGNFSGIYYSILAPPLNGMLTGVPVLNLDTPGQPSGFHFTVEPAAGGETIHKIKGVMAGTADGAFPFTANIEGELDCKTATFTATLIDGMYSVLTAGLAAQKFDGVMSGHYDKRTHTFVDGSWDVRESSAMPPGMLAPTLPRDPARDGYGGFGQWAASLATDLTDPTLTQCPASYTCKGGPLGPNKLLCNNVLGVPTCLSDAECEMQFPGEGVLCLKASAFSLCVRECKP